MSFEVSLLELCGLHILCKCCLLLCSDHAHSSAFKTELGATLSMTVLCNL